MKRKRRSEMTVAYASGSDLHPPWYNSSFVTMMTTKRDFYEILEITREADADTITKAYRRLAMKYHPDRNVGDKEAEEKFKEAAAAYDILRDPDKRARYDRYGHAGLEGMGGAHD